MFIRRKPNKTGSVSVQVIDKSQGRLPVLKSFGTGRTEFELSALEQKAHRFIREKTGLANSLFPEPLDNHIEDFVASLSNSQLQVIGPELVFGALYDKIGYNSIDNELFRHLVITRLFHPGSKLKTIDHLYRYQGQSYSPDRIYRFHDELCSRKGKEGKGKSGIRVNKAREPVKNMYRLTYQLPTTGRTGETVLKMDREQEELVELVQEWVRK